jgi:hypothetical protein
MSGFSAWMLAILIVQLWLALSSIGNVEYEVTFLLFFVAMLMCIAWHWGVYK